MMSAEQERSTLGIAISEVRYPLAELIREVQAEKETSTFGQEIVDQTEIQKLFKRKNKVRRGKSGE